MPTDDALDPTTLTRGLGTAPLALVILVTVLSGPAGAAVQSNADLPTEPALVVALAFDGSARVTLAVPFDLATQADRDAFEALRANDSAAARRTHRFADRMATIAARAEGFSGREMRIVEPEVRFVERGSLGVLALTVTWSGLAAHDGDALVVREPFASGFVPDRAFHLLAPDGYVLATVEPPPSTRTDATATWAAGTSLEGFDARLAPVDEGGGTAADAHGIGILAGLVGALVGAGLVARRAGRR